MFQQEPAAFSHRETPRRPRRLRLILLLLALAGTGLAAAHYGGLLPGAAVDMSPAEQDDALIARAEQLLARTDPPPQKLYSMAVDLYGGCHDHRRADPLVLRLVAEAARRGLPAARRSMGLLCRIGFSDQPRNAEQAREWYRLAAEDGELDAMILLQRSSKSRPAADKPAAAPAPATERDSTRPSSAASAGAAASAQPAPAPAQPAPADSSSADKSPDKSPADRVAEVSGESRTENLRPLLLKAGPVPVKHRVCTGDSFAGIARQYGISVDALRRANPGITDLAVGSNLLIPDAEGQVVRGGILPDDDSPSDPSEAQPSGGERIHTVSSGETLGAIARRYGVSLMSLLKANNMSMQDAARIHVGQRIVIP